MDPYPDCGEQSYKGSGRLANKIALITGADSGIGRAVAIAFAREGADVAIAYLDEHEDAQETARWVEEAGRQCLLLPGDIAQKSVCQSLVDKTVEQFGRIDVLVNNAGITRDQSMRKMELPHWAEVMRTNLDSLFNMSKQVLEPMLEKKWGRIINISSVNGQKGAFGQCNYAAAKAGVHGFSKALALEVARHGITVNTVSPGYLRTQMVTAVPADILETKILPQIPLGRLGEPDDVAGPIVFLASDMARYVTGASLLVDGGLYVNLQ